MLFCDQCGNQLKDGAKFCSKCGHQVSSDITPTTQEYDDIRSSGDSSRPTDFHIPSRQQLRQETYLPPTDMPTVQEYDDLQPIGNSRQQVNTQIPVYQPVQQGTGSLPPVIAVLSKKLKTKAVFEITESVLEIISSVSCFIYTILYLYTVNTLYAKSSPSGETSEYSLPLFHTLIALFFITFGVAFLILGIQNCLSALKDLSYRKSIAAYPVGIVQKYEQQAQKRKAFSNNSKHSFNKRIQEYVALNRDLLIGTETWFMANDPNHPNSRSLGFEERQQAEYAVTAQPAENKNIVIAGIKNLVACVALFFVITFVYQISLPYLMTFDFTAEEYINMYNSVAYQSGNAALQIDRSRIQQVKNDEGDLYYYCPIIDQYGNSIYLFVSDDDYSNPLKGIRYVTLADSADEEIPTEFIYQLRAIYTGLSYDEAKTICENVKRTGTLTPSQTPGIEIRYEFDSKNDWERWTIVPD